MDASLFSSFTSQKRGRRSREKMAATPRGQHTLLNPSSQLSKEGDNSKTSRQSIGEKQPQDKERLQSREGGVNVGDEQKGALSPSTANPSVATTSRGGNSLVGRPKSSSGFDDDEFLDLLGDDSDEDATREKPRRIFQIKSKSSIKGESSVRSASGSSITGSGSKAFQKQSTELTSEAETHKTVSISSEGVKDRSTKLDTSQVSLKFDSSPLSEGKEGKSREGKGSSEGRGGKGSKGKEEKDQLTKGVLDFGDNDDLLSGMGLEDNSTPEKSKLTSIKGGASESRIAELLGTSKPPSKLSLGNGSAGKKGKEAVKTDFSVKKESKMKEKVDGGEERESKGGEKEEDSYQFGGYLPSMVTGSRPTGLPNSGIISQSLPNQKFPSTLSDSSLHKQSQVTRPAEPSVLEAKEMTASLKKSVRFSDNVQSDFIPQVSCEPVSPVSSLSSSRMPTSDNAPMADRNHNPVLMTSKEEEEKEHSSEEEEEEEKEQTKVEKMEENEKEKEEEMPLMHKKLLKSDEHRKEKGDPVSRTIKQEKSTDLVATMKASENYSKSGGEVAVLERGSGSGPHTSSSSSKSSAVAVTGRRESKLKHPVFPWQKKKPEAPATTSKETEVQVSTASTSSLQSHQLTEETAVNWMPQLATDSTKGSHSVIEQSIQEAHQPSSRNRAQEKRRERKWEDNEEREWKESEKREWKESGERETGKSLQHKVQELESELSRENTLKTDLQARVSSLQQELEESAHQQKILSERLGAVRLEKAEQEASLQHRDLFKSQAEELKLKLHKTELERDQLKHSLESSQSLHVEKLAAVQKSFEARIKSEEESFQRRETKWCEEVEMEEQRQRERLNQQEKEKTDSLLTLRKKIESLEADKANEIAHLQQIHRSSVLDLKRDHELDLQHLKELHRQEVDALKTAHSHTHRLSELTAMVESTTHSVGELQSKVEQMYTRGLDEGRERSRLQEQHLKILEERLSKQQREAELERQQLEGLVAKLEAHLSQRTQELERERWQIQQDSARLRARETSLEKERVTSLAKLEDERRMRAETKERFLSEQQQLLSQCLTEQHSVAAERAQLTVLQKKTAEKMQRETQMSEEVQAELETAQNQLKEKQTRLANEASRLEREASHQNEKSSQLAREREALEREKRIQEGQRTELEHQREEVESARQSATATHQEGEGALEAAHQLQTEFSEQAVALQSRLEHIEQREMQLATERLTFARECRGAYLETSRSHQAWSSSPEHITTTTPNDTQLSLPTTGLTTAHHYSHSLPPPLQSQGRPRTAEVSHTRLGSARLTCTETPHTPLSHSLQSHRLRTMALEVKEDELDLEEEMQFIRSIQSSHFNSTQN